MAWGRVARLVIGTDVATLDAIDLSNLDFEFEVKRTIHFEPSTANFTIYNVSKETRALISTKDVGVSLSVGHEDGAVGEIFSGAVVRAKHSVDVATTVLTIEASNSRPVGSAMQKLLVSLSFTPGASLSSVVSAIGQRVGLVVFGLANISDISLPNGWAYSGSIAGAYRYLRNVISAYGRGFFVDLNSIVCYKVGEPSIYDVVTVGIDTGLLSIERDIDSLDATVEKAQITPSRSRTRNVRERPKTNIRTLLIPQLQPNGLIRIDREDFSGVYHIETITYSGSRHGDDWTCSMEAYENV